MARIQSYGMVHTDTSGHKCGGMKRSPRYCNAKGRLMGEHIKDAKVSNDWKKAEDATKKARKENNSSCSLSKIFFFLLFLASTIKMTWQDIQVKNIKYKSRKQWPSFGQDLKVTIQAKRTLTVQISQIWICLCWNINNTLMKNWLQLLACVCESLAKDAWSSLKKAFLRRQQENSVGRRCCTNNGTLQSLIYACQTPVSQADASYRCPDRYFKYGVCLSSSMRLADQVHV